MYQKRFLLPLVALFALTPFVVSADELVINGDTGVDVDAIVNRVEITGAQSFAPKSSDSYVKREDIPERIIRITDRAAVEEQEAQRMNSIMPAAGDVPVREPSDGGKLGAMPLTAAEEFARGHNR